MDYLIKASRINRRMEVKKEKQAREVFFKAEKNKYRNEMANLRKAA